jgi:hypothetical protein
MAIKSTNITVGKRRYRHEAWVGRRPLPLGEKRLHKTVTFSRRFHAEVCAHRKPGEWVERCIGLARCVTREQYEWLVYRSLATGVTADQIIHVALRAYIKNTP